MNIEEELKKGIAEAFESLFGETLAPEILSLQPTRKEFDGSFTFVTFPYGRITKKKPEEGGELIGEYLKKNCDIVTGYNVVKGFLNIGLSDDTWLAVFDEISELADYGFAKANGKKVMVEYSSPNTNKPLHLGHLRNNFLGFSVAEILKAAGYDVMKTNLVNDRGVHICKSMLAYQKFGEGETPESSGVKGDHLIGKYYVKFDQEYKKEIADLVEEGKPKEEAEKSASSIIEAQEMLKRWENGDPEIVDLWKRMNGWVYDGFEETYRNMGVDFDKFYYESETYLLGKDIVHEGLEKGVFNKRGDGSVWGDLTDEKMDEKLVLRADGTSVYITQDMGTADLKYKDFPFEKSVYVVGNEQDYHFAVLFAFLRKLGRKYGEGLHHLSYGMVDLPTGKMKSREGTVVDADDLMKEMVATAQQHTEELGKIDDFTEDQASELYKMLGMGALKYFLLKVDPKKRMLFDPKESIEFQGNTGPFIQYTHARIASILRKANQLGYTTDTFEASEISNLAASERDLINQLMDFPKKIVNAAEDFSPALIAQYIFDLAKDYNRFYADLPIFNEENKSVLQFRIALSATVAGVLKKGMKLLGIDVPDRM